MVRKNEIFIEKFLQLSAFITILTTIGIVVITSYSIHYTKLYEARKGIFNPGAFSFENIMIIFLAVMLTDVILLDVFNTFGMPTSTTVSIVFELLGASVGIAFVQIRSQGRITSYNVCYTKLLRPLTDTLVEFHFVVAECGTSAKAAQATFVFYIQYQAR